MLEFHSLVKQAPLELLAKLVWFSARRSSVRARHGVLVVTRMVEAVPMVGVRRLSCRMTCSEQALTLV